MSDWEQTRDRLLHDTRSRIVDRKRHMDDIRAALERVEARDRRIAFMEGVDEREGSGWCGEHPRMFSLRPDAEADGECLMCANAALRQRVEELEASHEIDARIASDEIRRLREENARLRAAADDQFLRQQEVIGRVTRERDVALADLDFQNKEAERVYRGNQNRIGELCAEVSRLEGLILMWDYFASEHDRPSESLYTEARRIRGEKPSVSTEAEALRVMGDSQPLVKMREYK